VVTHLPLRKGDDLSERTVDLVRRTKDILGHVDVKSTEVYIQIDLDMKREALTRAGTPTCTTTKRGRPPKDLLAWLEAL